MNKINNNHNITSINDLLIKARSLYGKTIGQLAAELNILFPEKSVNSKGLSGIILETILGADAKNLSAPDFLDLGVELKTVPVDYNYKSIESTYVCTAPLLPEQITDWQDSSVFKKLKTVLFIPLLSNDNNISNNKNKLKTRVILEPLLFYLSGQLEQQIKEDWQELTELIQFGNSHKISAKIGKYLHIRPKGKNALDLKLSVNNAGNKQLVLPRGFYLRQEFTNLILSPKLDDFLP